MIIATLALIVRLTMAANLMEDSEGGCSLDPNQEIIMDQLPSSLHTAQRTIKLDGRTTMYAVCPDCNACYEPIYVTPLASSPSYPSHCEKKNPGPSGLVVCGASLLKGGKDGALKPQKPFLMASLEDFIGRTLADSNIEMLCDKACDDAMESLNNPTDPRRDTKNVFEADFMHQFKGPDGRTLFIDRKGKVRLALALQMDFLNPNGIRKRGNHDSISMISMANLNLPEHLRYQPEHIFLAGVIPGPKEPNVDEIPNFIRPLIDICLIGWERGIHISRTASAPEGRDTEIAIVLSVNDLPAAPKLSGTAAHSLHWYCTVCDAYHKDTMYDTCFENWGRRDIRELRRYTEASRDATTINEREKILKDFGVRWSELWRLPYWDPSQMLVIDSMHCILEGLVHYHCLSVLEIDYTKAGKAQRFLPAYAYPWITYSANKAAKLGCPMPNDNYSKDIAAIHKLLVQPIGDGKPLEDGTIVDVAVETLKKRLEGKHVAPLQFVCCTLNLPQMQRFRTKGLWTEIEVKTRGNLTDLLIDWVCGCPLYVVPCI